MNAAQAPWAALEFTPPSRNGLFMPLTQLLGNSCE
jgi:hypothetical protein